MTTKLDNVNFISYFDQNVFIDEKHSAVTMICVQPRPICGFQRSSNHAQIIVERVHKGKFQRFIIELLGPSSYAERNPALNGCSSSALIYSNGAVIIVNDEKHLNKVNYSHKSKTWRCEAAKVEEMLQVAKNQRDNPLEHPKAFSIFGSKSIFTSTASAYQITDPILKKLFLENKSLFVWLYKVAKNTVQKKGIECFNWTEFIPFNYFFSDECGINVVSEAIIFGKDFEFPTGEIVYLMDSDSGCIDIPIRLNYKNIVGKKTLDHTYYAFAVTKNDVERKKVVERLKETYSDCSETQHFIERVAYKINEILEDYTEVIKNYFENTPIVIDNENISKKMLDECGGDYLVLYRKILKMIAEFTDLKSLIPDSCFTWARDLVNTYVGANIEIKDEDKYWAYTKSYLIPKEIDSHKGT